MSFQSYKTRNRNEPRRWGRRVVLVLALAFIASLSFGSAAHRRRVHPEARQQACPRASDSGRASADLAILLLIRRVIVQFKHAPTQHHSATKCKPGAGRCAWNWSTVECSRCRHRLSKILRTMTKWLSIAPDRNLWPAMCSAAMPSTSSRRETKASAIGAWASASPSFTVYQRAHDDLRNTCRPIPRGLSPGLHWHNPESRLGALAYDTYGHEPGVLARRTDSGGQVTAETGISYGVNLIDLRVLDGSRLERTATCIAAIQRAIALKSTYNIRIILFLGRPVFGTYTTDPLCQAVERHWKAASRWSWPLVTSAA